MKKLFSLLLAALFALSLSFATFAEDKPGDKPAASEGKKKAKKKHAEEKKEEGKGHKK